MSPAPLRALGKLYFVGLTIHHLKLYLTAVAFAPLVLFNPGGLTKCDRKKEGANNTGKNQNVSNTFHGSVLLS